jgi:hypothetical protein
MWPRVSLLTDVFNINYMCFADYMTFRKQYLREGLPIVSVKSTSGQMPGLVVELLKYRGIRIAEHPSHGSSCAAVNGFDKPKFVF